MSFTDTLEGVDCCPQKLHQGTDERDSRECHVQVKEERWI